MYLIRFFFQIKNISAATPIPIINSCVADFRKNFQKIDNLQLVIDRINKDLIALEESVSKAEGDLGYNNTGLTGFLKPFFGKNTANDQTRNQCVEHNEPTHQLTTVFNTSDFFGTSEKSKEDNQMQNIELRSLMTKLGFLYVAIFLKYSSIYFCQINKIRLT